MTTNVSKRERALQIGIVVSLFILIFVPSQMPTQIIRNSVIGIVSLASLIMQLMVQRQTTDKTFRTQGMVLIVLTIVISAIMLLM